jgi:hypothetical protein
LAGWRLALLASINVAAWCAEALLTAHTVDYAPNSRFGRMEIRGELQGVVDLTISANNVAAEIFTGSRFEGAAVVYSQPLARVYLRDFRARAIGEAKVKVLEPPVPSNRYTAKIRIESKQRHLANIRLYWESDTRFQGTPLRLQSNDFNNALTGHLTLVGRFAHVVELKIHGAQVLADGAFVQQQLTMTQPLPMQKLMKFRKHGKVEIVEPPGENNNFTATLRIGKVKPEAEDRLIELDWSR